MSTIEMRQDKNKALILEQLKKTPIIQIACQKIGVGRTTYYRWKNLDQDFAQMAEEALSEGFGFINDMAESKIIAAIQNDNLTAAMYWLNHRHLTYRNKIELTTGLKQEEKKLSPEQQDLIDKALKIAALIPTKVEEKNEKDEK